MSNYEINIAKISKSFKNRTALSDIDLKIERGSVVGLFGPNGAGKTTLLKILATLIIPDAGAGSVFGYDILRKAKAIRSLTSFVSSEERSLYWRLTPVQNLNFFSDLYNIPASSAAAKIDEYFSYFQIGDIKNLSLFKISSGAKQKLQLIRAFIKTPSLLLIDEISKSLDEKSAQKAYDMTAKYTKSNNAAAIIVSHNREDLSRYCDYIIERCEGKIAS